MKKLKDHVRSQHNELSRETSGREVRYSDAYGRQRHHSDDREERADRRSQASGSEDVEKTKKWEQMTKLSSNYARWESSYFARCN